MEKKILELISSNEMGILDNNAEWLGIPKSHLMECAGYSFATEIVNQGYLKKNSKTVIFCGTGNNGGDGFVIARHLSSFGARVLVLLIGNPEKIRTKEAQLNWRIISKHLTCSVKIQIIRDSKDLSKIGPLIESEQEQYGIIIDGLLGTGIKGKIREPISSAIDLINTLKKRKKEKIKVLSIDVPSGLDPDTGTVSDKAVRSDLVITFHRIKKGMKRNNDHVKEIIEKPIGIPQEASIFVGKGDLLATLTIRKIDNHKGQFGRILVIGGSKDYSGAPAYCSLTAINFGIDLVITYAPQVVGDVIRSYSPNMIVRTSPGDWLNKNAITEISSLIDWSDSVVIGPGMGQEDETEILIIKLIKKLNDSKKSFVLDADALKLVKNHFDLLRGRPVILTPHEAELKVMTGVELPSYSEVEERGNILLGLAKKLKVNLLIKGPYDFISNGNLVKVNRTGCPEMSIGGTGDILAGLCACFLATGSEPFQSACSAAFLNGIIGEYSKKNIGPRFTSMDMIRNINNSILYLTNKKG